MHDAAVRMIPKIRDFSNACGFKYGIDPDDIFQNCFVKLLEAIEKKDDYQIDNLEAYLMISATKGLGVSIRFASRYSRFDELTFDNEPEFNFFFDPVFRVSFEKCMKGVTEKQRQTLSDIYVLGMTMDEAGKARGKSKQSISLSHKGAMKRIRSNMGVEIEDSGN